jgi:hypothetical protein
MTTKPKRYSVEYTFSMYRGQPLPREYPVEVKDARTGKVVHYAKRAKDAEDWIKEQEKK